MTKTEYLRSICLISAQEMANRLNLTLYTYNKLEQLSTSDFYRKVYDATLTERILILKTLNNEK